VQPDPEDAARLSDRAIFGDALRPASEILTRLVRDLGGYGRAHVALVVRARRFQIVSIDGNSGQIPTRNLIQAWTDAEGVLVDSTLDRMRRELCRATGAVVWEPEEARIRRKRDGMTDPAREDVPDVPKVLTGPCGRFVVGHYELVGFIGFVASLATRAHEVQRIARKALAEVDGDDRPSDDQGSALTTLRKYRHLVLEMGYVRAVDNYLMFLSDLLALLYAERPETLRVVPRDARRGATGESVPIETIFEHSTMEELVDSLVERRVTDLSFKGLRALSDYLADRLGFSLFEDDESYARATRIVETRNVIVHNRGAVTRLYLARVGTTNRAVGEVIELDVDEFFADLNFLARSSFDIDVRAVSKWSLPTDPAVEFGFEP
jgi:hypothetical protein